MDSSTLLQAIVLFLFIIISAFFSSSETALTSLSKIRIRQMVEEKVRGAVIISKLTENPSKMLSAILVGNNVVNIASSALATSIAIRHFGEKGVGISTAIMTVLLLVFAEITPKSIASRNPEGVSLKVAKGIYFLTKILNPISIIFIYITNTIIKIHANASYRD